MSGENNSTQDGGPDGTTSDGGAEAIPTGATLALGLASVWVPQNGQAVVPFTVTRNGVSGALTVHTIGLPTGVTAADVAVPDGQTTGSVTLAASASATLGGTSTANVQLFDQTQQEAQQPLVVSVSGKPGERPALRIRAEGLGGVMVDGQGRIVAVGDASKSSQNYAARMRSAADGTLDSNYAGGGIGVTIGVAEGAALGNDDRLYIVGYTGSNLTIFRYWP